MKYVLLIIPFLNLINLFAQKDSSNAKKSLLNIELGYSTSMFFENYSGKRFNTNEFGAGVSFCKLGYTRGKISLFTDFKIFFESNPTGTTIQNKKIVDPGFVLERYYLILDLGVAYAYHLRKLNLFVEPSLLLSARPDGLERVAITPNTYHFPRYHTASYGYKSYGFGCGLNLRKHVYKKLYIGLETQYNHFFEKKIGAFQNGFQEFDKNYKINRNMITAIVKLGYQINLGRKK